MIPTWVAVVAGISLAILALSAIAIAVSSVAAALGVRAFLRVLRELAGPAVGDVRQLVGTIRSEAEGVVGTSRELRERIVKAAASVRMVRRGLSLVDWGRRALKRRRKH